MKHKNETTTLIKEYIVLVNTQFNKKPKIIRSVRGQEYINNNLSQFCKSKAIKA